MRPSAARDALLLSIAMGPILSSLPASAMTQCGVASWYEFTSKTASGEKADPSGLTAAHPSLPFGTMVLVENLKNGKTIQVRVNDRGPSTGARIIDVSRFAAKNLHFIDSGTTRVRITPEAGKGDTPSNDCH